MEKNTSGNSNVSDDVLKDSILLIKEKLLDAEIAVGEAEIKVRNFLRSAMPGFASVSEKKYDKLRHNYDVLKAIEKVLVTEAEKRHINVAALEVQAEDEDSDSDDEDE